MQGLRTTGASCTALAVILLCTAALAAEPSVEELKARFASANIGERPRLCVQIAEKQETEANRLYSANDFDKAQNTLSDVVAYSELARDYAIQSHKYQKQTEIAVRGFARKLGDLMRTLPKEDQGPVHDAINRLQRVRDDLLSAMFPKGAK
ncbi:MAG TPA: hypothetical protein VKV39_05290 [Candidatus Sulfotelmatobacter sp.]|nr:hypothetical protein [Candidatus Sulfotelmatobacter sp.]